MNRIAVYILALRLLPLFVVVTAVSCTRGSATTAIPPTTVSPTSSAPRVNDQGYFPELPEFEFRFTSSNNTSIPEDFLSPVRVNYLGRKSLDDAFDYHRPATVYRFQRADTGAELNLLIPAGVADAVELPTDVVCGIKSQSIRLINGALCGLVIKQDDNLVFAGISEAAANSHISVDDGLPIRVEQSGLLSDHYIEGDESWIIRKTNTEITFSFRDQRVRMHQGESAVLGEYEIRLPVAHQVERKPNVLDAYENGISYVISRLN